MKIQMILSLLSPCIFLCATPDNLLKNGDFRQGLSSFQLTTVEPAGKVKESIQLITSPQENKVSVTLGENTAKVANFQQATATRLLPNVPYELKCRIMIAPGKEGEINGGNLHFRIREWKDGKFLRNSVMIWAVFDQEKLNVVACRDNRQFSVLNEKKYQGRWFELSSVGMLTESADGYDVIMSIFGKPLCTIEITDIQLHRIQLPPIAILSRIDSFPMGKDEIALEIEVNPASENKLQAVFGLKQNGKTISHKQSELPGGKHIVLLPAKELQLGKAELIINSGAFTERMNFTVEEDPFAE